MKDAIAEIIMEVLFLGQRQGVEIGHGDRQGATTDLVPYVTQILNLPAEGWVEFTSPCNPPCTSHECTVEKAGEPCWVDGGECKDVRTPSIAQVLAGKGERV